MEENDEVVEQVFDEETRKQNHRRIVEESQVGDIVAFAYNDTKARSAKVKRKSSKKQKLEVQTAYGKTFIIDYDRVLWVKKIPEARWPHGVYKALKGDETND